MRAVTINCEFSLPRLIQLEQLEQTNLNNFMKVKQQAPSYIQII